MSTQRPHCLTALAMLAVTGCGTTDAESSTDDGVTDSDAGIVVDGVVYPKSGWPTVTPASDGFDASLLDAAATLADEADSHCLVVVHGGRIVGEWYFDDWDRSSQKNVFSATKSIIGILVGIAQDQGALDIDERASLYIPEWVGTKSEAVTIRQLLNNTSGRFWSPESDYLQMAGLASDKTEYAVGLGQDVEPGKVWEYNNSAIQTLERVMKNATGVSLHDFAEQQLFLPLGMQAHLGLDAAGNTLAFSDMVSSCRDLARFGYLTLRSGRWGEDTVVSSEWVAEATSPSSTLNAAYGYLFWLNRDGHWVQPTLADGIRNEGDGKILPDVPESVYLAWGLQDQLVVVHPDSEIVIARIGGSGAAADALLNQSPLTEDAFVNGLVSQILAAYTP